MPKGTFKFIFDADDRSVSKEFVVAKDAHIDTVIEAFATFLELCGWTYRDEEIN